MSVDLEALIAEVQGQKHVVPRGSISERETEVLRLVCDGMSAKSIGRELGISSRTVEKHRWRISQKTGCTTGAQLGVWAVRNGVICL